MHREDWGRDLKSQSQFLFHKTFDRVEVSSPPSYPSSSRLIGKGRNAKSGHYDCFIKGW